MSTNFTHDLPICCTCVSCLVSSFWCEHVHFNQNLCIKRQVLTYFFSLFWPSEFGDFKLAWQLDVSKLSHVGIPFFGVISSPHSKERTKWNELKVFCPFKKLENSAKIFLPLSQVLTTWHPSNSRTRLDDAVLPLDGLFWKGGRRWHLWYADKAT